MVSSSISHYRIIKKLGAAGQFPCAGVYAVIEAPERYEQVVAWRSPKLKTILSKE